MNTHFTSFTPEAMRAFGQELADGLQRRLESLGNLRNQTFTMLTNFRKEHASAEAKRRALASREADARRLSTSELTSGVHSLLGRFELNRKEMAADLQEMARELHATCNTWRARPGQQDHAPPRGPAGPQPKQPQKQPPPSANIPPFRAASESQDANAQPFRAGIENQDGTKARSGPDDKAGDSKKRHG